MIALHTDPRLHAVPPLTPVSVLLSRRRLLLGLGVLLVVLAFAAVVDRGQLLLTWDRPIQQGVESSRTSLLDDLFRAVSHLGGTGPVLALGGLAAAVTWRRCRAVSVVLALSTMLRPGLESLIKGVVGRERPNFAQLVAGEGPSFPAGHALAAVALWGMLPLVVSLYTRRRAVWWAAVWISLALVAAIAGSRVYLGVHWFTDVAAGLVVGAFFLLGMEAVLGAGHRWQPCRLLGAHSGGPRRGAVG